jgi:hypothetical protein
MTLNNIHHIVIFSIIALLTATSFGLSNVYAEKSEVYNMVGPITPVLTFTFRDGIETYEFPVFEMGENFADNFGVSFSVEGTVTNSPLLHQAMDQAYQYRLSSAAYDYHLKYFDVDADFINENKSVITLHYHDCTIDNYQVETLDSNDYESYFAKTGFAIVDKIDFECSGIKLDKKNTISPTTIPSFTDFGKSGFKFANNVTTSVTFTFENGVEKIEFPVFNLVSGYEESADNVIAEFEVEGILDYYPLMYNAIDKSRQVYGLPTAPNIDFDALVEFTNDESVLRGIDFKDCRVSNAEITTRTDKEEGFTGKSGFAIVNQFTFTCAGIKGVNMYYDDLRGDTPTWKTTHLTNEYVEPIQNTDKGMSAISTFTFTDGTEIIEFSMFKQSKVLSTTIDSTFLGKANYPTLELRGIVGDYPMLYNNLDNNRKVQGVGGIQNQELVDIDVDLVSAEGVVRGFNFENCRAIVYKVSTNPNSEESYVKNMFALENIFEFECQGYHPNNPAYDAMFDVVKANTESTTDLKNTDQWGADFTVQK